MRIAHRDGQPGERPARTRPPPRRRTAGPAPCRPSSRRRRWRPTRRGPPRVPTRTPDSQEARSSSPSLTSTCRNSRMPLPHISACEPSALRWSMNHSQRSRSLPQHRGRVGHVRAADHPEDAVAAEPRPPVAQPPHHRGVEPVLRPHRAVGIGQHHEVVLGAVPEEHPGGVVHRSIVRAAISAVTASSRSGRAASNQVVAGSRRNHDRWRRTKRRVVRTVRSRASSGTARRPAAPAPARSRARATPSGPPAARPRPGARPRRRSRPPTSGPPARRSARPAPPGRGPPRRRRPGSAGAVPAARRGRDRRSAR